MAAAGGALLYHYNWLPRLVDTLLIGIVAFAAVTTFLFYVFTGKPESIEGDECRTENLGQLEVADCNAAGDGPLYVHTRFPRRFLVNCGFWVITRNEHLRRMIIDLKSARVLERRQASAPDRTVERGARKSGARPSP